MASAGAVTLLGALVYAALLGSQGEADGSSQDGVQSVGRPSAET